MKASLRVAQNGATAKMYRIHRALMVSAFEAVNVFKRQGNLKVAEEYRQVCLDNFYKMKNYELMIIQEVR